MIIIKILVTDQVMAHCREVQMRRVKIRNIIFSLHLSEEEIPHKILDLYNKLMFNGELPQQIKFKFQSRNPFLIAYSQYHHGGYTIVIDIDMIFHRLILTSNSSVGNIRCKNKVDCVQILIEHELIHILKHHYKGYDETDPHGEHFRILMKDVFCHTTPSHNLLDGIVNKRNKGAIQPGDYVDLGGESHNNVGTVVEKNNSTLEVRMFDGQAQQVQLENIKGWIRQ